MKSWSIPSLVLAVLSSTCIVLSSCSSTQSGALNDNFGYNNYRPETAKKSDPSRASTSSTNLSSDQNDNQQTQSEELNTATLATNDDTSVVADENYYSSGYTPVISPWWNGSYGAWSYAPTPIAMSTCYSPWTRWHFFCDPFDYDPFSYWTWGYGGYSPYYAYNPYYSYAYGYGYGSPWYYNGWYGYGGSNPYGPRYSASNSARTWGTHRSVSGSPGTSVSIGGMTNGGARQRGIATTTSDRSTPQTRQSVGNSDRVREVEPRNRSIIQPVAARGGSPFADVRVSSPPQTTRSYRRESEYSNSIGSSNSSTTTSSSATNRVRSVQTSSYTQPSGGRSTRSEAVSSTSSRTVSVPSSHGSVSTSRVSSAPSTRSSSSSSGSSSSSSSSSGGGRKR